MYVKPAGNVIELLEFFASRRRPATPAEIADALGWPRSSTFNLVTTLVWKGYLYEPRARSGYYPSLLWRKMAEAISEAEPLPEVAERLAQRVADESGETCCIAAAAGLNGLLVYAVESRQPIRFSPWLGERNPIHCSASGRAILSLYSEGDRERLYRKIEFQRFAARSPMTAEDVEAAVREGIERGYFVSKSEVVDDLVAAAVPLPLGERLLAITVAGPSSRCEARIDGLGRLLEREAALAIKQYESR